MIQYKNSNRSFIFFQHAGPFGAVVLIQSQSPLKAKPFHLSAPLRLAKTLESAYDFKILCRESNSYFPVHFLSPQALRNFDLQLLNLGSHEGLYKTVIRCWIFLQPTLLLSAGVTSSHDRAIVSHATTVGDSFLGARGGGVVWESYLLKSTFVVIDLEIRLTGFIALMKIP